MCVWARVRAFSFKRVFFVIFISCSCVSLINDGGIKMASHELFPVFRDNKKIVSEEQRKRDEK